MATQQQMFISFCFRVLSGLLSHCATLDLHKAAGNPLP